MEAFAGDGQFMDPLGMGGGDDAENIVSYEIMQDPGPGSVDLEVLRQKILEITMPFLQGYVWQRESFGLYLSTQMAPPWKAKAQTKGITASSETLWGEVSFGDNVEDEWFIVSLLQRATQEVPGLSARIWDNDGEFLLIEAAYHLPKWVKPEASTNRVFIRRGLLHLVPLPSQQHPTLPSKPTEDEALQIIRSGVVRTEASDLVQDAIRSRVGDLPEGAAKLMHTARLRLPAKCAAALAAEPAAVGPAVEAFYTRDMQDMKAAARQKVFPPVDMVTVFCRFNRCLYAQLVGQPWEPPKGYPMPPSDSPASKPASLGAKMTAGLEILLSRSPVAGNASAGDQPPPRDRGGSWQAFLKRLEGLDYFEGELQGSRRYKQLEQAAWNYFGTMTPPAAEDASRALLQRLWLAVQDPVDNSKLQEEGSGHMAEDDDSWLTSAAEELQRQMDAREAELEAHTSRKKKPGNGPSEDAKVVSEDQSEMERLTQRMGQFMEHLSGLEGAEVPASALGDAGIDFNPDRFLKTLGEVLGFDSNELGGGRPIGGDDSSSEGSSFFSDDDSDASDHDNSDDDTDGFQDYAAPGVGGFKRVPDWDVQTDTDSDDEDGLQNDAEGSAQYEANFMQAYSEELDAQLRGTTMAGSFARTDADGDGSDSHVDPDLPQRNTAADGTTSAQFDDGEQGDADADKPVDLDLNLVSSLLESYASQEGLPGPASNLAGMLGIKLPK